MAVLEVHDTDDVIAAVRWADQQGVQVTAQPVGHGANFTLEGTLILRTRGLHGIEIDVQRRTATIGSGVKAGELCTALEGTGLTFLCGSNAYLSVTGMTITGGISWFGRAYGLGADSIVSVELVDGPRSLPPVLSADEDAELFWAVRGGGGDFGIITKLEVALHPTAPRCTAAGSCGRSSRWARSSAPSRRPPRSAPVELTTGFDVYQFPPLPEVPEADPWQGVRLGRGRLRRRSRGGRDSTWRRTARSRDMAMDLVGEVPLGALGSIADEPTGQPDARYAALAPAQRARRPDAIEVLAATVGPGQWLATDDRPRSATSVGRSPVTVDGAGAHGPVTEPYSLFALGVPAVPELIEPIKLLPRPGQRRRSPT